MISIISTSCSLLVLLLLNDVVTGQRSFTDSKGDTFTVADGASPPRIVINANGALSLFHLGLPSSQLAAVYDHWVVRGSSLDPFSGDYNSEFGIDPNEEEIAFLQGAVDLTPDCSSGSDGCYLNLDADGLASLDGDVDFVVLLRGVGGGRIIAEGEDLGTRMIWIDDKYEKGTGCYGTGANADVVVNEDNCYGRSLIDVVLELERFADFLGVEPTDRVRDEQEAMCNAAANFVEHSQTLHDRGIHAAAVTIRPFNGLTLNWFPPISWPWLRTLEELGFPLLHPPDQAAAIDQFSVTITDWFVNCDSYPQCSDEGANIGVAPIDLWLMDSRTYALVDATYDDSLAQFPDPAFESRQYTYWQFNDGAVSYTNIARYLNDLVAATSDVQRVHQDAIACADIDVTSNGFLNAQMGGVNSVVSGSGTYACRGNLQSLYLDCPALQDTIGAFTPEPSPDATTGNGGGGAIGGGGAGGSPARVNADRYISRLLRENNIL